MGTVLLDVINIEKGESCEFVSTALECRARGRGEGRANFGVEVKKYTIQMSQSKRPKEGNLKGELRHAVRLVHAMRWLVSSRRGSEVCP